MLLFRPPAMRTSPELEWMLLRAFGPERTRTFDGSRLNASEASKLASQFRLEERIAGRTSRETLASELGADFADRFLAAWRRSVVHGMRLRNLAGFVAERASQLDIPLVFLKFAALSAQGIVAPGLRPAADVDVLVPSARIEELQNDLAAAGLTPGEYEPCGHHLVALRSPSGGVVELHRQLPGVRFRGRRSIGADELLASGRIERLLDLPGACSAPSREVHAAYLLVHGFVQHGSLPKTYSLIWVLADLIDLGSESSGGALVADSVAAHARREISTGDISAVLRLCRRLSTGDESLFGELAATRSSREVVILRHILARTLSLEYQNRLVIGGLVPLSDSPRPWAIARVVFGKLSPNRSHLDEVYGAPQSELGYWRQRIVRPFDLFVRFWRYSGIFRRRDRVIGSKVANATKIKQDMSQEEIKRGAVDETG